MSTTIKASSFWTCNFKGTKISGVWSVDYRGDILQYNGNNALSFGMINSESYHDKMRRDSIVSGILNYYSVYKGLSKV